MKRFADARIVERREGRRDEKPRFADVIQHQWPRATTPADLPFPALEAQAEGCGHLLATPDLGETGGP